MEFAIRSRYNDHILHEAMRRYAIAPEQISLLDGFESYIYEFTQNGGSYILRIGHSLHRTPDLIRGEVAWINYLAEGGAGVARAMHSTADQLVEAIDDGQGGQFLTTAFYKAPGNHVWEEGWTPARYTAYGQLLGRIHALSRHYTPADPTLRRYEWNDPLVFIDNFHGLKMTRHAFCSGPSLKKSPAF